MSYSPMSSQQEFNEMMMEEEIALEIEEALNNKAKKTQTLTKKQDSLLTQTEQLPSTTTPTENQQNESKLEVNSQVLQNLMSTLPPELSQILVTAIQQLPSESTLEDLVSLMNSLTDEEISDSQLESLEELFL